MNLLRGLYLLLVAPSQFEALAKHDMESRRGREQDTKSEPQFERAAKVVRGALVKSLLLVLAATAFAVVVGRLLTGIFGQASSSLDRGLQYAGVGVLLWATLAKQGWNIQTLKGETLPERLNQVIYRAFYVLGSFLLVLSLAW